LLLNAAISAAPVHVASCVGCQAELWQTPAASRVRGRGISGSMSMTKKPPFPGSTKGPAFTPQSGSRPTVGLPRAAFGGPAPTVGIPGAGGGFRPGKPAQGAQAAPADITRILQLGGAHLAAGRLDHAGQAAAHVLKLQPQNPDALHLLGLVALGKEDAASAEKLISAAAKLMPKHPNIWVNLGNAQREQGKADEALASYGNALGIDRDYADAFLQRGILYRDGARYVEALEDFERLIGLRPSEPSPYLRAAETANDLGEFRKAMTYCERASAILDPVPTVVFAMMAATHERLSNLEEALRLADEVLAREPLNGGSMQVRSKALRRLSKGDRSVLKRLRGEFESADISAMPSREARFVYSELAQICDLLGDIDSAFRYFTLQNEATLELPELKRTDKRQFIGDLERHLEILTDDFVSGWVPLPEIELEPGHAAPPVFLVGFPRSGTTLLDQILDSHPNVQVLEERPVLMAVRRVLPDLPQSLATLTEGQRAVAREAYWSALRREQADLEGKTVVNKMPLDITQAGLIHRVFPEARIIFALRHPADCVLSCFMQDFVPNASMLNFLTLEGSAKLYACVMTLWQRYRALLPLNVHEVRYENLIADLRSEVGPALEFLGLPWHDAVSDPAAHALARGTIRTPSYSQVTQPIYSSAADRWRRYEEHMRPVMPILEAHIKRFGYSL